jgi:hypothetical protein
MWGKNMEIGYGNCNRCGRVVYPFSGKESTSSNVYYCVGCSEELAGEHKKNVCSLCTDLISRGDIKFVMPSRIYSNYFFDRLPLENRLMCLDCYKKVERLDMIKNPWVKLGHIKARLHNRLRERRIIEMASNR